MLEESVCSHCTGVLFLLEIFRIFNFGIVCSLYYVFHVAAYPGLLLTRMVLYPEYLCTRCCQIAGLPTGRWQPLLTPSSVGRALRIVFALNIACAYFVELDC
jgi:hypothetical protein